MKHILIAVMLIALMSLFALSQTTNKQKSRNAKAEQELIKLEEEWHSAYVRHEADLGGRVYFRQQQRRKQQQRADYQWSQV